MSYYEIQLVERGPPELIPGDVSDRFSLELPLRALARAGVVTLGVTSAGFVVTPGHHVGELRTPGATLTIAPKSPAMLGAMERLALRARSRATPDLAPRLTNPEGEGDDLAGSFRRALVDCVHDGIPWAYASRTENTSFPRGRLDATATARRLAARGIHHRVISVVPTREQPPPLIVVVRAAASCLPGLRGSTPSVLAEVEALLAAFDVTTAPMNTDVAVSTGEVMLARPGLSDHVARLVARSLDVLRREQLTAGRVEAVPNGVARFRDLEELWERCVLAFVAGAPEVFSGGVPVLHGLRGRGLRLLADGGPELDPDVVVAEQNTNQILGILDAKYKSRDDAAASAGDLYQLVAYVRRTDASFGMLVQFSEEGDAGRYVGTTPEGAAVLSVSLSPRRVQAEGERALAGALHAAGLTLQGNEHRMTHSAG